MTDNHFSQPQLEAAVRAKLAVLLRMPFEDLLALPATSSTAFSEGPRPAEVWTYVDREAQDAVRFVAQISSPDAPGSRFSQVYSEGFRRWADGRAEPVSTPEIYEFM